MKQFFRNWWATLLIIFLLVTRLFVWANVRVDGRSMDPTLTHNDRLFVLKVTPIDRFDIVVAKENDADGTEKKIVKRVIGLPGDVIAYKNDVLTINGEIVDEPYLADYLTQFYQDKLQEIYAYSNDVQSRALRSPTFTSTDNYSTGEFSLTVPDDAYYLLGDNRIVSNDSRHVGTFKKDAIIGEVYFRFYPFSTIGTLE